MRIKFIQNLIDSLRGKDINKNSSYSRFSICDQSGRIYEKNNKIYRAITKEYKNNILELISSNMFKELVEKGWFPKTKITKLHLKDYSLVLEHEKLNVSSQTEWSFGI